jgi:gas vesicle protein
MFSRVRIAIRFFFVGLAVGVLLAPRSGEETRRMVRQKADRLLNDVLDAATLGTAQTNGGTGGTGGTGGREGATGGTDEELSRTEQVETPKASARSNGGSSRSRKTASESTAGAGS